MTPNQVYDCYLGIRNHFHNADYDFFTYQNRSCDLTKRKDEYKFAVLSRRLTNKEVIPFMVANFVDNDSAWIGDMSDNDIGRKVYLKWKSKIDNLFNVYKHDLGIIDRLIKQKGIQPKQIFIASENNQHPAIIRLLLGQYINLESFIILNKVIGFIPEYDRTYTDTIWQDLSFKCMKYDPFIKVTIDKYKDATNKVLL